MHHVGFLYIRVLTYDARKLKHKIRRTIFDKSIQIMAYVDDVVIRGRRLQDVEIFTLLVTQITWD